MCRLEFFWGNRSPNTVLVQISDPHCGSDWWILAQILKKSTPYLSASSKTTYSMPFSLSPISTQRCTNRPGVAITMSYLEKEHGEDSNPKSTFIWLQWESEIRPFVIWKHMKSRLLEGWISTGLVSNGHAVAMALPKVPTIQKTWPFKIRTFFSGFQMIFDKIASICPDFKWFGFWISEPIQNPDRCCCCYMHL